MPSRLSKRATVACVGNAFMAIALASTLSCELTHTSAIEAIAERGLAEDLDAGRDAAAAPAPTDDRDAATAVRSDAAPPDAGQAGVGGGALFVPVKDRVDVVHDARRGIVYVSTRHGEVLEYDLEAQAVVRSIQVGGQLSGLDLSPNGDLLLVADRDVDRERRISHLHIVDLRARTVESLAIDTADTEFGTFNGVFLDDARALVACSGYGSTDLRLVQLDDGTVQTLMPVRVRTGPHTVLTMSADRSTVAFAADGSSAGDFGRYDVATAEFETAMANGFVYDIAISPDATRLVVLKQGDALFFDGSLRRAGVIERRSDLRQPRIAGVAWSPVANRVYLASTGEGVSTIEEIDADSLSRVRFIDTQHPFKWHGNHPFESGRLRTSRDGRILLATVDGGIVIYRLEP